MMKSYNFVALLLLLTTATTWAQVSWQGVVLSTADKQPVAFATVKFGETGRGVIAGLDGTFAMQQNEMDGVAWIEVSCLGFEATRVAEFKKPLTIYLTPSANTLSEVVVRSPVDKIKRILDSTLAHKNSNNPDLYNWYRCKVYYKMVLDLALPDRMKTDTSASTRELKKFTDDQHLLVSETYSRRTWKRPQQLQEDVIGSRVSGLKKSVFTGMVTDILPFHSYNDYISLNGKDYHNPVSKGYWQYYKYDLLDELQQDGDTVWILSFAPRGNNANELKGKLYINSNGYAVANLVATVYDTMMQRKLGIEQQYSLVHDNGIARWFPAHLNYLIDWQQKTKTSTITYHLRGNSQIDSVSFSELSAFRFDKTHTVRLLDNADELHDSTWLRMRPVQLEQKDIQTYRVIDSFGAAKNFDKYMGYMSGLPDGKVAVGPVDIDLKRLFNTNYHENYRLGLGLQTNDKLSRWLSVGGWAGYGFGDEQWKYGYFAEVYGNRRKELALRAGYTDDINDPGRIRLAPELDKNYLRTYLLRRVDRVQAWEATLRYRLGYWKLELGAARQQIQPLYNYAFRHEGTDYSTYTATEGSLNMRFAFAERSAPFFGRYYSTGSRYPVWYLHLVGGQVQAGDAAIPYAQVVSSVAWHKHINRLGHEHILVEGGKIFSNDPLPLSKLFAGNGYRYDSRRGNDLVYLYAFGGLLTMYPYQYYTDNFLQLTLRHDMDWKLYKLQVPGSKFSSAPFIGLQYSMLYGTLQGRDAHQLVAISVPDNAYHEGGILLNNLVRLNYMNLYYLTLNAGYFYHFEACGSPASLGRLVLGASVEF